MIVIKFVVPLNDKNIASKEVRFEETEAGHLAAIAMALDWLKGISQNCHDLDESIKKKFSPKDKWRWYNECEWLWDKAAMPSHYTPRPPKPSRPYAKSSGLTAMPEADVGGLMPSPSLPEEHYGENARTLSTAERGAETLANAVETLAEPARPQAQMPGAVPSVTDMKFLKELITKNISTHLNGPNEYVEAEKDLDEVIKVLQDGVLKATDTQLRIRVHSECRDDGEQRKILCLHSNCPNDIPKYQTPTFIIAFSLGPKGYPIKTYRFDNCDVFSSGLQIGELKDKGELCNFALRLTWDNTSKDIRCIPVEAVNLLHRMDKAVAANLQKAIDALNAIPIPKEEKKRK